MMRRRGSGGPPLGGQTVLMGDDMESAAYDNHGGAPYHPYNEHRNGHGRSNNMLRSLLSGSKMLILLLVSIGLAALYLLSGMLFSGAGGGKGGSSANYASLSGVSLFLEQAPAIYNDEYVVFVSVSNGKETHISSGRSKQSGLQALQRAQQQLPAKSSNYPWIKLDVMTGIKRVEHFNYFEEVDAPSPWYGVALDWDNNWVFLPEEVHANTLVDHDGILRWERIVTYARHKELTTGWPIPSRSDDETILETPLDLFRTQSIFYDTRSTEKQPIPLLHGHRMYDRDSITRPMLLEAAQNAAGYLMDMVDTQGRVIYQYLPRSHAKVAEGPLQRQAGSLFAMAQVYRLAPDKKLRQAMDLALKFLMSFIGECPAPYEPMTKAKCVLEDLEEPVGDKESWTGTNAQTLAAIAEYMDVTDDWSHMPVAKDIAFWITHALKMDDWFLQWVQLPELEIDEEHYDRFDHSRTIFALARLYNLVRKKEGLQVDNQWIAVAIRATEVMVEQDHEKLDGHEEPDAWLLKALGELHAYGNAISIKYGDHVERTVKWAREHQMSEPEHGRESDLGGIYYDDDSGTKAAIISEGLCSVYKLAADQGKQDTARRITQSVQQSLRYQLQWQYMPEIAMYMKDPARIIGGFRDNIRIPQLRNDYTLHNIGSMVCAMEILKDSKATAT